MYVYSNFGENWTINLGDMAKVTLPQHHVGCLADSPRLVCQLERLKVGQRVATQN